MRYFAVVLLVAISLTSVALADAPMSPAVKAHLCGLAKRDAAFTQADIEKINKERAECLASIPPPEMENVESTCTSQGAKHIWGGVHRQARVICESTRTGKRQTKKCPGKTDYLEDADERVAKCCTED